MLYDDDGDSVWEPDGECIFGLATPSNDRDDVGPNVGLPLLPSSALELIDPQSWATIDG